MDKGTILVHCFPSTVPSLWPPPSPPSQCTVYTDSVWLWGGGFKCTVDHILQEFYTLFLSRFRTYKITSPPQTKMTSKDDIKGLVSLKFLRPWLGHYWSAKMDVSLWPPVRNKDSESLLLVLFHRTDSEHFSLPRNGFGTDFREFSVPWNRWNSVGTNHLFRLFRLPQNNFLSEIANPSYKMAAGTRTIVPGALQDACQHQNYSTVMLQDGCRHQNYSTWHALRWLPAPEM